MRTGFWYVLLLLMLACAGCATSSTGASASRETARRADTAGTVMIRGVDPVPARWAAWRVVGSRDGTTIEALSATGTNWRGQVVLRITVSHGDGQFDGTTATACYRYRFAHRLDDWRPSGVACAAGPAMVLLPPPPAPDLGAAGAERLRAAFGRPGDHRLDQRAVRSAVARAFPPPAHVSVTRASPATLLVTVRAESTCLHATVGPRAVAVRSVHGPDCLGG